jgi:hypothetical protein
MRESRIACTPGGQATSSSRSDGAQRTREKAGEWAKLATDEPDGHGVKWLRYSDQTGAGPMPLPRSLAYFKRKISEKKWVKARRWAGSRVSGKKYKLPSEQRPDRTVAGSSKRLASSFYLVKTGHCLTSQYVPEVTGNQPTANCWWCTYRTQTREHVFKNLPEWKPNKRFCGRRCGRRPEGGKTDSKSGTSLPI